jgi:hypothetical protein
LMKVKYYRLHLRKVNHQYSWLTHLERYLPNWNITCFFCTCMPETILSQLHQHAWSNNRPLVK